MTYHSLTRWPDHKIIVDKNHFGRKTVLHISPYEHARSSTGIRLVPRWCDPPRPDVKSPWQRAHPPVQSKLTAKPVHWMALVCWWEYLSRLNVVEPRCRRARRRVRSTRGRAGRVVFYHPDCHVQVDAFYFQRHSHCPVLDPLADRTSTTMKPWMITRGGGRSPRTPVDQEIIEAFP